MKQETCLDGCKDHRQHRPTRCCMY